MSNNIHTKEMFDTYYGSRTWEFYRGLLSEYVKFGMPGLCLDLGAGVGLFTECAHKFGIKCIGLEGAIDGVMLAKQRCPDIDIRHHLLEDKLPFDDESVSTIVCNQVIEHISPLTAKHMLRECYRVLKKNGVIFIYSPCIYVKKERQEAAHINLYTPKSLIEEVENSGFKVMHKNNSPRMIFGDILLIKYIMIALFMLFPLDLLSSSANCIAYKRI